MAQRSDDLVSSYIATQTNIELSTFYQESTWGKLKPDWKRRLYLYALYKNSPDQKFFNK